MLTELNVSQFAIIENLQIEFRHGLNIISGETGAGKSVLLRSLSLLMGAKASSEFIRTGSNQALIEGCFDLSLRPDIVARLEKIDIPPLNQNELIVRRIIGPGDKNKVYLNGSLSSVSILRDIVAPLIEVAGKNAPLIELTGQHENKNLLTKSYHLDLLDQFAKTWPLRGEYEALWEEQSKILAQMNELEVKCQLGHQRLDFLLFQRDEIKQFPLIEGEEHDLELRVKKLKNKQRISQFYQSAITALDNDDESIILHLQKVLQRGYEVAGLDNSLQEKLKSLESALSLIQDTSMELKKSLDELNNEDEDSEALEARLSQWRKLQKKYGPDVATVLKSLSLIESEIDEIQNGELLINQLKKKQTEVQHQLLQIGNQIHLKRVKLSKDLIKNVNEHLKDLNMKGVTFDIHIQKLDTPHATGITEVEFLSQTSPQDPPKPLSKVASGGELSRILLSLKCVLGTSTFPRTYLFDEVDTGVSGNTAEKVARKLKQISQGQQVICVTHLPQVAAMGDHHFSILKSPTKNSVQMEIQLLEGKNRVQEIARLISGETITATSIAHAKELLSHSELSEKKSRSTSKSVGTTRT